MAATSPPPAEPPTLVIVQGCFQTHAPYAKIASSLTSLGYPVIHPTLPSCSNPSDPLFPTVDLVDDALAVRSALTRLIEYEGKTAVVVMHSYGGLVGCEAISKDLGYDERWRKGLPGGVLRLFFFSAFLLAEGQSVLGTWGQSPNNDVRPDGRFDIKNPAQTLFNDLDPFETAFWTSQLIPQSCKVQTTELTRAAYRYVPSTYLICERDQAAPFLYQEAFAQQAGSRVERCDAGHSPMLSQPDLLVDKIDAAVKRAIAGLKGEKEAGA